MNVNLHKRPGFIKVHVTLQKKISKAKMKICKGSFHFQQGKGKMCSANGERLSCLTNLFFGFGTTFVNCPIGEVRVNEWHLVIFMKRVYVHPCLEHV